MISFKQFLIEGMVPGVSPGIDNEQLLLDRLRHHLANVTTATVVVQTPSNKRSFKDIVEVQDRSKDTRNRKKADFVLISSKGKEYPISLKNDKADFWESADTLLGGQARKIIDRQVDLGNVILRLDPVTENYSIVPCIAKKLNDEQMSDVMFGSDILPNGCVICRTFTEEDFIVEDSTLTINCTTIISSVDDVKGTIYEPWMFIRSEQGRNVKSIGYKGIRALAAYKRRIMANAVKKI